MCSCIFSHLCDKVHIRVVSFSITCCTIYYYVSRTRRTFRLRINLRKTPLRLYSFKAYDEICINDVERGLKPFQPPVIQINHFKFLYCTRDQVTPFLKDILNPCIRETISATIFFIHDKFSTNNRLLLR